MIAAPSVEEALRLRAQKAEPPPRPKTLRVSLPADLRRAMLPDLPTNVMLSPGRIEVQGRTAVELLESLVALALVMQNDLDRFRAVIEPPNASLDQDLREIIRRLSDT